MDFEIFYRNVPQMTLYQKCSNRSALLNKVSARAINRIKSLKRLFLLNKWTDFKTTSQVCSLGDLPPKLPKPFSPLEQDRRQSQTRELLVISKKQAVGIKREKSRHQRKQSSPAKRCEKSRKDAKKAMFYGKKNQTLLYRTKFRSH